MKTRPCKRVAIFHSIGILSVLLLSTPGLVAEVRYYLTDLGTLAGDTYSQANGINNYGQVVGQSFASGQSHAFLYSGGSLTDLGTLGGRSSAYSINNDGQVAGWSYPAGSSYSRAVVFSGGLVQDPGTLGGAQSSARGINDKGQVVGTSALPGTGVSHAFLYTPTAGSGTNSGIMTDLGALGGTVATATSINLNGQVAGYSNPAGATAPHAFLYSDGRMLDLGTFGGTVSYAYGINDQGQAVGEARTESQVSHAFLYRDGTMLDLGTLGGASSIGYAINNNGEIVGRSKTASGAFHGFFYSQGVMEDLNSLVSDDYGWTLEMPLGISDRGEIVGGASRQGVQHAFLLTPIALVPEPNSIWLLVLGGGAMLVRARTRRNQGVGESLRGDREGGRRTGRISESPAQR